MRRFNKNNFTFLVAVSALLIFLSCVSRAQDRAVEGRGSRESVRDDDLFERLENRYKNASELVDMISLYGVWWAECVESGEKPFVIQFIAADFFIAKNGAHCPYAGVFYDANYDWRHPGTWSVIALLAQGGEYGRVRSWGNTSVSETPREYASLSSGGIYNRSTYFKKYDNIIRFDKEGPILLTHITLAAFGSDTSTRDIKKYCTFMSPVVGPPSFPPDQYKHETATSPGGPYCRQ